MIPERIQPMKPILFSTEIVKAILDGRKTMTRRIIKPQPEIDTDSGYVYFWKKNYAFDIHNWKEECVIAAKYWINNILWVRETFAKVGDNWHDDSPNAPKYYYKADDPWNEKEWKKIYPNMKRWYTWRPSVFMPKEAARIFLKVTDVKVERLQDIKRKDVIKEGIKIISEGGFGRSGEEWPNYEIQKTGPFRNDYYGSVLNSPILSFKSLWESINGKGSWEKNSWVWVYEFEKLKQ